MNNQKIKIDTSLKKSIFIGVMLIASSSVTFVNYKMIEGQIKNNKTASVVNLTVMDSEHISKIPFSERTYKLKFDMIENTFVIDHTDLKKLDSSVIQKIYKIIAEQALNELKYHGRQIDTFTTVAANPELADYGLELLELQRNHLSFTKKIQSMNTSVGADGGIRHIITFKDGTSFKSDRLSLSDENDIMITALDYTAK